MFKIHVFHCIKRNHAISLQLVLMSLKYMYSSMFKIHAFHCVKRNHAIFLCLKSMYFQYVHNPCISFCYKDEPLQKIGWCILHFGSSYAMALIGFLAVFQGTHFSIYSRLYTPSPCGLCGSIYIHANLHDSGDNILFVVGWCLVWCI